MIEAVMLLPYPIFGIDWHKKYILLSTKEVIKRWVKGKKGEVG
jgi:hypothetical protein